MSEQPDQRRTCPTCGNAVPDGARYCPTCGTRLDPASYSRSEFEDVLSDVLDLPEDQAPSPAEPGRTGVDPDALTTALPPVTARQPDPQPEWTASASDWATSSPPPSGTWATQPTAAPVSTAPRGRRTLWIILAILGFIIFCCCGAFFGLLLVAESDTAFQEEISSAALLWIR